MARQMVVVTQEEHIDRLDLLCQAHFNYCNDVLVNKILELNPTLDVFENGLPLGTKVTLPDRYEVYK